MERIPGIRKFGVVPCMADKGPVDWMKHQTDEQTVHIVYHEMRNVKCDDSTAVIDVYSN